MTAYYNELDPYCAQWLRNLIAGGHIAKGDVDERSITDICADDIRGYKQCHFFAGIGGWSYALRLAEWPDDRPVWTGSCPCQPFSAAGKGKAADDERHLWPHWFKLIRSCRPSTIFGEQVEAAIGWGWLDTVFSDLGAEGYAVGAAVLPACGVSAPHIRQRLWFVANVDSGRRQEGIAATAADGYGHSSFSAGNVRELANSRRSSGRAEHQHEPRSKMGRQSAKAHAAGPRARGANGDMAHPAISRRHEQQEWAAAENGRPSAQSGRLRDAGDMGDAGSPRLPSCQRENLRGEGGGDEGRAIEQSGGSPWADCDWLPCTDGKARPVEPGTFPLAHGIPGRVGRLRAYGNAIVPQVAAEFIKAAMDMER